jgi:hypothetical protein
MLSCFKPAVSKVSNLVEQAAFLEEKKLGLFPCCALGRHHGNRLSYFIVIPTCGVHNNNVLSQAIGGFPYSPLGAVFDS